MKIVLYRILIILMMIIGLLSLVFLHNPGGQTGKDLSVFFGIWMFWIFIMGIEGSFDDLPTTPFFWFARGKAAKKEEESGRENY